MGDIIAGNGGIMCCCIIGDIMGCIIIEGDGETIMGCCIIGDIIDGVGDGII